MAQKKNVLLSQIAGSLNLVPGINHWNTYHTAYGTTPARSALSKVGFQQQARREGRKFEQYVLDYLVGSGWRIDGVRTKFLGVEIDIIARPPGGPPCLIECKGGNQKGRSGLARVDTVKKSIGLAWTLETRQRKAGRHVPAMKVWDTRHLHSFQTDQYKLPYLLITTIMPNKKTSGYRMLEEATQGGLFDMVGTINQINRWGGLFEWQRNYMVRP